MQQTSDSRYLCVLVRQREGKLGERRSDTKEADEAESNKALAVTKEPSGASTSTWQVMSNEFDATPAAALVVMGFTVELGGGCVLSVLFVCSSV